MRVKLAILLLFLPLVAFGQSKIFDFDARKGSLIDQVSGVVGTATDVEFKRTGLGLSANFNGTTSKIDVGSDIIGTKAVTICGWIKPYSNGEFGGIISDIVTNEKTRLYLRSNDLRFNSDGSTDARTVGGIIVLSKWHFIAVTRTLDGIVKYYIGDKSIAPIFESTATSDSGTPTAGTTNVIIGNNDGQTRTFDGNISNLQIYNGILSTDQINQVYQDFLNSTSTIPQKRNFFYPKATDLSDVTGLVAAYNFIPTEKTLTDISGNGNTGTINGALSTKDGLRGLGTGITSNVAFPTPIIDNLTVWSVAFKMKDYITGSIDFIFGEEQTKNIALNYGGDITFRDDNADYYRFNVGGSDIAEQEVNIVLASNGVNINCYVNGCHQGVVIPTTTTLQIGNFFEGYGGTSTYSVNAILEDARFYNYTLSESEAQAYHNSFVKPVLIEDFRGNAVGDNYPLEWNLGGTGSYEVGEIATDVNSDLVAGDKYLECNTAGNKAIPSKTSYGTWEFSVYKGGGTLYWVDFISYQITNAQPNSYGIVINASNSLRFSKDGASSFFTVNSYISNNTWYEIKVQRLQSEGTFPDLDDTAYPANTFAVFIRGGSFSDWTLVDVTGGSGSNPVTDNTYTTSNYFVTDLDASDRIANIKIYNGVIQ